MQTLHVGAHLRAEFLKPGIGALLGAIRVSHTFLLLPIRRL